MDQDTEITTPEAETAASLTLSGEQATEFLGLEPGDEVTLQLTGKDEKAGTVTFEKLTEPDEAAPEEDEATTGAAEEKVLGYKRPSVKKETPKLSAEDLMS
jgi:hypothetical protein